MGVGSEQDAGAAAAAAAPEWVLDLREGRLRRGTVEVRLTPRAFALLRHFAVRPRQLATTDELLAAVWPGIVVEEGQVRQFVADLRRTLGDDPKAPRLIETVRGRGYRWIGSIRIEDGRVAASDPRVVPIRGGAALAWLPTLHGRDDDLAALADAFQRHRLVSVVGSGGIGKSLLARHFAARRRDRHPDGIAQVELAPFADPALVVGAIAAASGVNAAGGATALAGPEPLRALVAALAQRRMLLVLDNAEHLIDEVARVAQELRDGSANLVVLVTSQAPLRVAGEGVLRLGPLAVPTGTVPLDGSEAPGDREEDEGAVTLFAVRARERDAGFRLDAASRPTVVEICRRLDGVPLALELAAARVGSLGLAGLVAALDRQLHDAPAVRGLAARQRTLAAALDWSHGLLMPVQQAAFRRLGVFAGGFTLAAAQGVVADAPEADSPHDSRVLRRGLPGGVGIDAAAVARALEALVDNSLVVAEPPGSTGTARWRMLQTTRAYAVERLAEAGELRAVRRRQLAHHAAAVTAALASRPASPPGNVPAGDTGVSTADRSAAPSAPAAAAIAADYPDIRGALEWAFSGDDGDAAAGATLAVALLPWWQAQPNDAEGERWLQRPSPLAVGTQGDARLEWLVQRLRAEGIVGSGPAAARGIEQTALMALARRLDPHELKDVDSAFRQLRGAVGIARAVVDQPAAATSARPPLGAIDEVVDATLVGLAASTRLGDFDRGIDSVDRALGEIERREAERDAAVRAARGELLEAGLRQELLRRDAFAAADRVLAIAALVEPSARPAWSDEARRRSAAFVDEGDRQGITLSLQVAIELARRRIETAADDAERGTALGELGTALATAGERDSGAELLLEAADVLAQALGVTDRAARRSDWAALTAARSQVLGMVGGRLGQVEVLRESVDACREALAACRRAEAPFDWAEAQHRLGMALRNCGALEAGTESLEAALRAFDEALKVLTPAREPLRWIRAKQGAGIARSLIGRREGGTASARRAVVAYREALQEATRERFPAEWAGLQNNLGIELAAIGELDDDPATLRLAVAAYREALKERTRDRAAGFWAATQHNLGGVLRLLGERVDGTATLGEAVVAFQEALREHTRLRSPAHWAATKCDLGMALIRLGERERNAGTLEEAVRVLRQALEVRTRERGEMPWALAHCDLGRALLALGEVEGSPPILQDAIDAIRAALEVISPEAMPAEYRLLRGQLEQARAALAALDDRGRTLRVVGRRVGG